MQRFADSRRLKVCFKLISTRDEYSFSQTSTEKAVSCLSSCFATTLISATYLLLSLSRKFKNAIDFTLKTFDSANEVNFL